MKLLDAPFRCSANRRSSGAWQRALVLIASGQGKGFTDEARKGLVSLRDSAAAYFTEYDQETETSLNRASRVSLLAHVLLFVLALLLYLVLLVYIWRLEREAADATAAWQDVQGRLERLRTSVSRDLKGMLGGIQDYAERLLQGYGDFLPRQGQEYAQRMKEMAGEMNGVLESVLAEGIDHEEREGDELS